MTRLAAPICWALGAIPLLWPLLINGYPILFSDTGGFLDMGFLPSMGWDKPFVYGPLIALLSLGLTLFLPAIAQAVLLSFALWRTQALYASPTPSRHLALCAALAALTTAPWFASTLMPDILAPIAVLTLIGAAYRPSLAAILLAAIAVAAHLSLLIVAAALVPALAVLRRVPWRSLASLFLAIALLLVTNLVGHGRLALSPYGAVFALARLVGDGPARTYLDRACPAANYALCAWRDRLTDDSDQFLWDPKGPFWADPTPLPEFAAQAARIVRATILSQPLQVLRSAYRNTATELLLDRVGDAVTSDYLDDAVRPRIIRFLPLAERDRFDASLQSRNGLLPIADALDPLYLAALAAAAAASAIILLRGLRRRSPRADLAALILIALAANAFATGALSKPHHRYEARIAWLLLLPVLLRFEPYAASNSLSPPVDRTSAS